MTKILQGSVGQFVATAFMVAGDKPIGRQIISCAGLYKKTVDDPTLPDVGNDDRIRTESRQIKLVAVVVHQPAKDRTPKPIPIAAPATKLV